MPLDATATPTRWLLKNTDTFAGFAHAMNSYLSGVALAARHGVGLLHRPQQMAHGMAFTFVDFFDSDPRGLQPPVYAPTLSGNGRAMVVNGRAIKLHVLLAANGTQVARSLDALPHGSVLWLRQSRRAFVEPPILGARSDCASSAPDEVCYTGLWLRERFWRAVMERRRRQRPAGEEAPIRPKGRGRKSLIASAASPSSASQSASSSLMVAAEDAQTVVALKPGAHSQDAADGLGPVRICVHVRRGDVYYLGPKTRKPHPHWVETTAVLDILAGVGRAIGEPLAAPGYAVDVYSEVGWLHNDTLALRSLAPDAKVHLDSSPTATVEALIAMSQADVLIMGSSGFSFWAGIFSCGVKIGGARQGAEGLPMRYVKYNSTITTRDAPFWPSAGRHLQREWERYRDCRKDAACRPRLCGVQALSSGATPRGSIWTRSALAKAIVDDPAAVQWRLPELVLWPRADAPTRLAGEVVAASGGGGNGGGDKGAALNELQLICDASKAGSKAGSKRQSESAERHGRGVGPCLRNQWLHNLTAFLGLRRKLGGGAGVVTVKV